MDANWLTAAGQMAVLAQEGGAESSTSGALGGAVTGADGSGGAAGQGAQPGQGAAGGGGMQMLMLFLIPVMFLLIFSSMMGGRKEKKKRAQMMAGLKKHDKVQTIGGVIGKVMEIGGDEVVLQVHESSKTRITFSKSAIQQVLKSGSGGGGQSAGAESEEAGAANGTVEKAGV